MGHEIEADVGADILPEYDFSGGVRGKHHRAYQAGTNVVFLDPDVAEAFRDSASVNDALRLLVNLAKDRTRKRHHEASQRTSGTAHGRGGARR